MPMNLILQEKRKELGLTQEQVAQYLNVSVPAVCKWEKGTTSPDISLLAPLARLLKTDPNTLLCFREDMSMQEISLFCKEVQEIVQTSGIAAGFAAAEQKLHEYPHNENLLHILTFQMDSLLIFSGLDADEMRPYNEKITTWYHRLSESADRKISNSADFMLASRFIRRGEYEKAQETLNRIPDRNDVISSMADKFMLQVELDRQQGRFEKAAADLQKELFMALNKVQMLLYKLMDLELECGEILTAKKIADKSAQMTGLFDLWKYNAFTAPLQIALSEKDAEKCISILRDMLTTMVKPWEADKTLLFNRITVQPSQTCPPEQMIPAILSEMEKEPFLQDSSEFRKLTAEYKPFRKTE